MTRQLTGRAGAVDDATLDETVEMVLLASRALVGVAARSLAQTESEITLRQYRRSCFSRPAGNRT